MLGVFLLAMAGLGILRINWSQKPNQYQELFDSKQQMQGYIVEDVDVRATNQMLTFRPNNFSQNILVTVPLTQKFFYGDSVVVDGKLTEPQSFDDFDYPKYLERFNIYGLIKYPSKVLILQSHQQNPIKEDLLHIKSWFVSRVGRYLPEPKSDLLVAILIGAKKTLPQDIIDDFNKTGTSHMIAISGFNITIIVSALAFLTKILGRKYSFLIVVPIIAGFVIMTGAPASVVRAAIMGVLLLVAALSGRQYSMLPSLFFAGALMLAINPKILVADIGFQLSFAATWGIVCFMPPLEKLTARIDSYFGIKEVLLCTMAAIAATLPLIMFYFGTLSLIAPLANILILPVLLPLSMLLGFLILLPVAPAGFAFAAGIVLDAILGIERLLGGWKYSSLNVQISGWVLGVLLLAVLGLWFLLNYLAKNKVSEM